MDASHPPPCGRGRVGSQFARMLLSRHIQKFNRKIAIWLIAQLIFGSHDNPYCYIGGQTIA
jgi:hypothetical protein